MPGDPTDDIDDDNAPESSANADKHPAEPHPPDQELTRAHNRVEVPAMLDEHSERVTGAWASSQPVTRVTLWLAFSVDRFMSGAGTTAKAAWASALESELLAATNDDSHRHATSVDALEAEVATRARRHRLVRMSIALDDVEALSEAMGVKPGGRVHGLIVSAARAAGGVSD